MIRKRILSLAVTTAMLFSMSFTVAFADGEVTTWKELYEGLIPGFNAETTEGYYDAVTTATKIGPNVHYQHIPDVVNKNILEANPEDPAKPKDVALNGVKSTVAPGSKEVRLGSATWETFKGKTINKQYGSDELIVYPDDTVEGYVWSDYLMAIYAVTISNGPKTVGALPWIDFYGEKATAGAHYNKVEIALNSGKTICGTDTLVKRFDDFYTDGVLNPGMYEVKIYADGYKTLTADIKVPTYTAATAEVADAEYGAADTSISFKGLPDDYEPALQLDGKDVELSGGKFAISGAAIGSHTVTVKDKRDKYNSFTASFTVYTNTVPAKFDGSKLVAADGVSGEIFASFIANISKVAVNGTEYIPRGRGSSVAKIVQEDGSLDFSKTGVAAAETKVAVAVTSTGFPEVNFESYTSAEAKARAEAKDAVAKAKALNAADYTTNSFNALTSALTALEALLADPAADSTKINEGTAALNGAIANLQKAEQPPTNPTVKQSQPMKVTAKNKTFKAGKLAKKKAIFKAVSVKNAQGGVTYTVKGNKKSTKALKFNKKNGKITVRKGTKKGKYVLNITVNAAGNELYEAGAKTVKVTVKVK